LDLTGPTLIYQGQALLDKNSEKPCFHDTFFEGTKKYESLSNMPETN